MSRHDDERLADIINAIEAIRQHRVRGDLSDALVFDAIRMRLLEIGEAVKGIAPATLNLESQVPWEGVAGMRDRLAHHYFDTSYAVIQVTLDEDLPLLEIAVRRLVTRNPEPT